MGFGGPKKGDQEKIVIQSQIQVQTQDGKKTVFSNYQTEGFFDELIDEQGRPRPDAEQLVRLINQMQPAELVRRHRHRRRRIFVRNLR